MKKVLAMGLGLALVTGCDRLPNRASPHFGPPVRGVEFVDWTPNGYASPLASLALDDLASTGANSVVLVVTAYQAHATDDTPRVDAGRTPSAAALRTAIDRAHARGLDVILKPHVDVDDGSWRGTIAPPNPSAWFDAYANFILPLAALAESTGATHLVVGTELAGTLEHEDRWRALIRRVRVVYSGKLTYAAAGDELPRVTFWRELDLIGVDFYFPVADRRNAGRLEILAGWQRWLERLSRLHDRTGRNILLTEVGYRSVDGAAMNPSNFDSDDPLDLGEQSDLYWAALEATHDVPWVEGLCWWDWPAVGPWGTSDRGYTARGKPAAIEIANAWGNP